MSIVKALRGILDGYNILKESNLSPENNFPSSIKAALLSDNKMKAAAELMERLFQASVEAGEWVGVAHTASDDKYFLDLEYYGYIDVSEDGATVYPTMHAYSYVKRALR